jgi:hypothetical protein
MQEILQQQLDQLQGQEIVDENGNVIKIDFEQMPPEQQQQIIIMLLEQQKEMQVAEHPNHPRPPKQKKSSRPKSAGKRKKAVSKQQPMDIANLSEE